MCYYIFFKQLRSQAACKIQALVRKFLHKKKLNRQKIAATIIQTYWKGHSARLELRRIKEAKLLDIQNAAAIKIQVCHTHTIVYIEKDLKNLMPFC